MRDLMMIDSNVRPIQDATLKRPALEKPDAAAFGQMVSQAINDVNQQMGEADKAAEGLTLGTNRDIHGTMIAMEKASISFQLITQVRNKIIDAYKEIQRMSF